MKTTIAVLAALLCLTASAEAAGPKLGQLQAAPGQKAMVCPEYDILVAALAGKKTCNAGDCYAASDDCYFLPANTSVEVSSALSWNKDVLPVRLVTSAEIGLSGKTGYALKSTVKVEKRVKP